MASAIAVPVFFFGVWARILADGVGSCASGVSSVLVGGLRNRARSYVFSGVETHEPWSAVVTSVKFVLFRDIASMMTCIEAEGLNHCPSQPLPEDPSHICQTIWIPLALLTREFADDWVQLKVNFTNWRGFGKCMVQTCVVSTLFYCLPIVCLKKGDLRKIGGF